MSRHRNRQTTRRRIAAAAFSPALAPDTAPTAGAPTTTTVLPVAGMTCRTCEVRIQRYVGHLPGVDRVEASAVHGRVVVVTSAPVPASAIVKAISMAGYEVGRNPWLERDPMVWLTAAGGIALVALLAVLVQVTGLGDLAGRTASLDQGGLAVALLLGLAAGVSTCMALVGGLVLALSASFSTQRSALAGGGSVTTPGVLSRMRPALVFVGGRIAGYAVLGAVLGTIGASVAMPAALTAFLMITVAVVMTLLGTRLTGLSPRIAGWSPTLPLGLGRRLGLAGGSTGASTGGYSDARAAGLGAASFFLPCGFTQAVQIYALSTGSPLLAGAVLAIFAIGTAPGLLAVAGLPVVVPTRARPTLLRLLGVVVLGFALVNAGAGLRLAGIALPTFGAGTAVAADLPASVPTAGGTQTVRTVQLADGYSPDNVSIYAGVRTRWVIDSKTTNSCAASIVVPSLGISARLHLGANTIELPALRAGTVAYSCAMGMYGGTITVVDRPIGAADGQQSAG